MHGDLFGHCGAVTVFGRVFAMPSAETYSIPPISQFVKRWLPLTGAVIDPFARNSKYGTLTNDLDPTTSAMHHMDAGAFCALMASEGKLYPLGLFDPPYSPRQISEVYKSVGLAVGMKETQNSALYKRVRDAMDKCIPYNGIVLSFGWNSNGMGKGRGYQMEEVLIVNHGGAHNDTICVAERKMRPSPLPLAQIAR